MVPHLGGPMGLKSIKKVKGLMSWKVKLPFVFLPLSSAKLPGMLIVI